VRATEAGGELASTDFDVVFIGNYTKDTIVSAAGTRVVDGGGFNYGAHVAAMMRLKTAAVTRLAAGDQHVVERLERIGVTVFPTYTQHSTELRLEYPSSNPDERTLKMTASAGAFTAEQVRPLEGRAFLLNGSVRGEIGLDVIAELKKKDAPLVADAQAFLRVVGSDGTLRFEPWPERNAVLSQLDILKADAVEGEALTGEHDLRGIAAALAALGPKEVVLTHRDGVVVLAAGEFHEAAFTPRQLVGRSGRGDTCIAAYVSRRLSAPARAATEWAAAVTTLKLEAEGPMTRSLEEVEQYVQSRARLASAIRS
jgi:sugar/nucleoside kinase (ribokinase family)